VKILARIVPLVITASFAIAACFAATPVILISIDTLRADHLGSYGYRKIATPNIDSFAEGGTLFSNIACQTPLTLPSHTTLFTSTYPFENGIQENAEPVPPNTATLAAVLKSHGYKTAAFVSSVFLEKEMGLDQGFDTYDSPFNFAAFSPISGEMFFGGAQNSYAVRDRREGALTLYAALRWLHANQGQNVFVFIHFFDLHTPYSIPEAAARGKGISRYDAQLAYEDEIIGRLKKALIQGGWWDKALTILLSDHGEGLGEHGEMSHGYFIYQSALHVPLLVHWPAGYSPQPPRIEQPGGLIDVAPTVLDFLRLPAAPTFEGVSLLSAAPREVYSESFHTHDSFGWSPLRSLRAGDFKYILAPHPELYNLRTDPAEQTNLVTVNTSQARDLRSELAKVVAQWTRTRVAPAASSPQTERLLASLGYLASGPRAKAASPAPDPKDRLAEFHLYEKAEAMLVEKRLTEAVVLLQQVLAQDTGNLLARRDLAGCYLDLHDYPKARANFQMVVTAASGDYPSQFGLGVVAKHLGLTDEARVHLEAACRLAPHASQCSQELDDLNKPSAR